MREFKARSFNKERNKYYYFRNGRYYDSADLSHCVSERVCSEFEWRNAEKAPGLKDKNGVEIYEGDFVDIHISLGNHEIHEVYYDNEMCEFGFRNCNELLHSQFSRHFEVIGNIHENQELLK